MTLIKEFTKRLICKSHPKYPSPAYFIYEGYQRAFKEAIHIVENHSDWIPVTERLPEEREKVLTCDEEGCQEVCEYSCGGWWVVDEYSVDVIAWQPLPKPYKGE